MSKKLIRSAVKAAHMIEMCENDYLDAIENGMMSEDEAGEMFKMMIVNYCTLMMGDEWQQAFEMACALMEKKLAEREKELEMDLTVLTAKNIINGKE